MSQGCESGTQTSRCKRLAHGGLKRKMRWHGTVKAKVVDSVNPRMILVTNEEERSMAELYQSHLPTK